LVLCTRGRRALSALMTESGHQRADLAAGRAVGVHGHTKTESDVVSKRRPESRHVQCSSRCLLWAKSGHRCVYLYATTFCRAVSRKKKALDFGVRFCVLKSTCTSPKRFPKPEVHSKLSIVLQWK